MNYPKIETLFERDKETFKVLDGEVRLREFGLINHWVVTEKIDGTNIRVIVEPGGVNTEECKDTTVSFAGRTDKAQIPVPLFKRLKELFPVEAFEHVFQNDVSRAVLYGEGYGEGIQKGGGGYREGTNFRLFDVRVEKPTGTWWLNWVDVEDVARKLDIKTVPVIYFDAPTERAVEHYAGVSLVADEEKDGCRSREGIVARTDPLLFDRRGHRVMWKLKEEDFG